MSKPDNAIIYSLEDQEENIVKSKDLKLGDIVLLLHRMQDGSNRAWHHAASEMMVNRIEGGMIYMLRPYWDFSKTLIAIDQEHFRVQDNSALEFIRLRSRSIF